jgi:hypothetical protein
MFLDHAGPGAPTIFNCVRPSFDTSLINWTFVA